MSTSPYMPDVKVEIAWDGGFRVPMADWTWTDVSDYVELAAGLTITGGRGDERSIADANTLTLTLDNSDGRFTAGRVTSPYYPNVKLYRPIRVLATPVDGGESERFTGFINSLPVEWDGTAAYAKAAISAASRLSRLGLNAAWRSLIEETFLADDPMAYYPLSEAEGATQANDVSGFARDPLVMTAGYADAPDVVFGEAIGPGTDDLTAASFSSALVIGGKYLIGYASTDSLPPSPPLSVECFFLASAEATYRPLVMVGNNTGANGFGLFLDPAGSVVSPGSSSDATSPLSYTDGALHHAAATISAIGVIKLYVDGVLVDTGGTGAIPSGVLTMSVGGPLSSEGIYHLAAFHSAETLNGVIAHAAAYNAELSAGRVEDHAASGLTGYAGETTDARLVQYAELAGIPAAEVDAEAGSTTMAHLDTTGSNVVELLRLTETTEAGVLFDSRGGLLTMHNRQHRYMTSSVLTLDMALNEVEADYSPRLDPTGLANDISTANTANTVKGRATDDQSVEDNGSATASITTASESKDEPQNLASWNLFKFKEPQPRVPTLSVNATAQAVAYDAGTSTVSCADVMAVDLGDRISVANHPSQAAYSITDYFVEGYTETYGPESLELTWNVSPTTAEDQVLIIDDPVRGVIDTNVIGL